ncbi:hypothetical protein FPRO05_12413 [Fusarium proliferatum]|uniref:BTB domain-containing protein n=1 Tax=Gibberella intermedia TaxID=948311 RepID=A0A365N4X7_GIBIN|nr:hypothetical protein FPRO05_12413 [Fusarium proliferatum]
MNIEERKLMHTAQKAGQFTDFAFLCKGTKIPVHKVIICAQSKVFNAACTSGLKESTSGVYDLSEYPLEFVERMVDHLYVGHYDDPSPDASKLSLSAHLLMLVLADKYVIQGLESEAKASYIRRLKHKNVEREDFLQSLPVLYELPVAVSRDAIDAAVAHAREAVLTCTSKKASMGVIDQISDASKDFLKEVMLSIMTTPLESRCSDCSKLDDLSKSSQELPRSRASQTNVPGSINLFGSLFAPGPGTNAPSSHSLFAPIARTNALSSSSLFAPGPGTNAPSSHSLFAPRSGTNAPGSGSLIAPNPQTNVSSAIGAFAPTRNVNPSPHSG